MSPLAAAVVLLWVVVIVLAFAMAGLLQKVRSLEVRGVGLHEPSGLGVDASAALAVVAPSPDKRLSVVMIVESHCVVCAEMLPRFAELARSSSHLVDFLVLSDGGDGKFPSGVRVISDPVAHRSLEPGYFPAILTVTPDLRIESVEPAGAVEAVEHAVATALSSATAGL